MASECWSASYEADDERLDSSVGQPVGAVREEQRVLVPPNAFVAVELIRQRPPRLVEVRRHVEVRSARRFGAHRGVIARKKLRGIGDGQRVVRRRIFYLIMNLSFMNMIHKVMLSKSSTEEYG